MKIKLAILENDKVYLNRIVSAFNQRYADKLEIYSFTDADVAINAITQNRIDVIIADETIEIDRKLIPSRCALAYLVNTNDIESFKDEVAISKFQKADLIYKQILNLYSENSSDVIGMHFDENDNTAYIAFMSPAGGTGCSTAAASYAIHLAKKGKRVLFLGLEAYGCSDVFFSGEGTSCFSDVIYAIKSKKGNISLKLESTVKQDSSGVFFYSSSRTALDMLELKPSEIKKLMTDLKLFGAYDYIILDMDFSIDEENLELLKECNRIVLVSDGSTIANKKLERAVETLTITEQQNDHKLFLKIGLLYNRVSSHSSSKPNLPEVKEFGGIKRFEGFSVQKMIEEISSLPVFDSII